MRLSFQSAVFPFAALCAFAVTLGTARVAEEPAKKPADGALVDNPVYVSWAKVKPGTKVEYKTTVSAMGRNMARTVMSTLVSVTPEKVLIEEGPVAAAGVKAPPARKRDIPAKVAKTDVHLPPDFKGTSEPLPDETLTIGGKTYACNVYSFEGNSKAGAGRLSGKLYLNDAVPGTIVKMATKMTGKVAGEVTMEIASIEEAQ